MADEEEPDEVPVEKTELQLKVEAIGAEFEARRKPLELRKELWSAELGKLGPEADASEKPAEAEALLELSLVSAKLGARREVIFANLEEADRGLHALALEQARENEKARLALEPPEED